MPTTINYNKKEYNNYNHNENDDSGTKIKP